MLTVISELPWIPLTNLPCFSTLAHILSSSFTSATEDCTILILIPRMYLILPLTLTLAFVTYKKNIYRYKIEGADAARILQHNIGFPSSMKFKSIVKDNQI